MGDCMRENVLLKLSALNEFCSIITEIFAAKGFSGQFTPIHIYDQNMILAMIDTKKFLEVLSKC